MRNARREARLLPCLALGIGTLGTLAHAADQLVYVPLDQPCRVLDTRSPGPGPLSAAHGKYSFAVTDTAIEAPAQNGNAMGCGIPAQATAVSVNINQFDATAAGNIRVWSTAAGDTGPSAGSAVYNPSVASPQPGDVVYNGATVTTAVAASVGTFYVAVSNGQIDMTINAIGYWLPVSWGSTRAGDQAIVFGAGSSASGLYASAVGHDVSASGNQSAVFGDGSQATNIEALALGHNATASGDSAIAIGGGSSSGSGSVAIFGTASGDFAFALGGQAQGDSSITIGATNTAQGASSVAIGSNNIAAGSESMALGALASNKNGTTTYDHAFAYSDGSTQTLNTASYQFMARAKGGFVFYTDLSTNAGAQLAAGSGSWTSLSDRNAKDSVQAVDARDVLDRVATLPLASWHYKAQDPRYRHLGPMAQDFYAAFGLGESDTGIDTVDADGVALAAIQGLNARLNDELAAKTREIAALHGQLDQLAADVAALRAASPDASPTR